MGPLRKPFQSTAKGLVLLGLGVLNPAWGASPLVIGESVAEIRDRPIAPESGHFMASVNMASNLPINRPFRGDSGGGYQDFQFQASRSMGIDFEMGWTEHLSFGVFGGWESFETRLDTSAGNNTEFQKAAVDLIPIVLSARYRFRSEGWSPEIDLGAGMGLFRFRVSSTNESGTTDRESTASFMAHALAGARFHWNESWALGFHTGYRYTGVGKQSLNNGIVAVETRSFTGLYSRGSISYIF